MSSDRIDLSNEEIDLAADLLNQALARPQGGYISRHTLNKVAREINKRREDRARELKRALDATKKVQSIVYNDTNAALMGIPSEQQAIGRVYEERRHAEVRLDSQRHNALRAAMDWLQDDHTASAADLLKTAAVFENFLAGKGGNA